MSLAGCVRWGRLVLLQPLRSAAVDDLFSEPHQADERTQGAGDDEAALETVGEQVLTVERQAEFEDPPPKKVPTHKLESRHFRFRRRR